MQPKPDPARFALPFLLAVSAFSLTMVGYYKSSPNHFRTVEEGVLYRSGILRPYNLERVVHAHDIKTIVNLIDPEDDHELAAQLERQREHCRELDIDHVDLKMPPETPPTEAQLAAWMELVRDPARQPVMVHCYHGATRTGMMVAAYRIGVRGEDNQDVLLQMPNFGHSWFREYRSAGREFILTLPGPDGTVPEVDPAPSHSGH